jgi:hypothetical protein
MFKGQDALNDGFTCKQLHAYRNDPLVPFSAESSSKLLDASKTKLLFSRTGWTFPPLIAATILPV